MSSKPLYKSKAFWASIASIATGIGLIVAGDIGEGAIMISGGLRTIFLRDAMNKAEAKTE